MKQIHEFVMSGWRFLHNYSKHALMKI